ncbi:TetR family transcriptional regulator [Planobispora rosea]|uniref:TetR family transcriptional regulator n=1 Tax=Planobispora rosea TaxID=35762 RepID=A0A8J3S6C9_PLARO|nr:TetR/AcrR family transcriptional regulator [Planobispora rosea]GGT03697.1 TetR family transcriptional regulator [Planobispora rosea]GIH88762.1 TetR family transcriptional regulator [Planobispora rosea]
MLPSDRTPETTHHGAAAEPVRPQRADGRRNQARVLEEAFAAFAAHGAAVPIREIARRAGVSTGTVTRHFPTKQALFQAVALHRIEQLVRTAEDIAAREHPATAFFTFFAFLVRQSAADHAVGDALTGAGFDLQAAASTAISDFGEAMAGLLTRAQQAGAVRDDVDTADVKALIAGCIARGDDDAARQRMIEIAGDGLRPRPARAPGRVNAD